MSKPTKKELIELRDLIKNGNTEDAFLFLLEKISETDGKVEEATTNEKFAARVASKVRKIKQGDKGEKGEQGYQGMQGKDGRRGERGEKGEVGNDGKDGKNGINGNDGEKGEKGEAGDIKDLAPTEIRDSLELLQGKERLTKDAIDGLDEFEKDIQKKIDEIPTTGRSLGVGGGRINTFVSETPTGTVDGANDTFYISATPKNNSLMLIWGGQPQRPGASNEYVLSGKKIVFNADSIPTTGGLWAYYSKF